MTRIRFVAAGVGVLLAVAACGRPPVHSDSPETIVAFFLTSAAAGNETAARSVSTLPDVPHVDAWKITRADLVRAETGQLSAFRVAFSEARKAEDEVRRLRAQARATPDIGIESQILSARTRITAARGAAPLMFELYDGGRAALFFGDHRFEDLVGPYVLERVDVEVTGGLWMYAETNRKQGPYRARLARVGAFGEKGRWLIYDLVDRRGTSILMRSDSELPPGVTDIDQLLQDAQGSEAAAP
jgi:hypothetical protein